MWRDAFHVLELTFLRLFHSCQQCCNIFEMHLPTYQDAISPAQAPVIPPHEGIMENCACGMPLEMLFARELARDHGITDEGPEGGERGRTSERKAEFESGVLDT